jgi:hypothetical protein
VGLTDSCAVRAVAGSKKYRKNSRTILDTHSGSRLGFFGLKDNKRQFKNLLGHKTFLEN